MPLSINKNIDTRKAAMCLTERHEILIWRNTSLLQRIWDVQIFWDESESCHRQWELGGGEDNGEGVFHISAKTIESEMCLKQIEKNRGLIPYKQKGRHKHIFKGVDPFPRKAPIDLEN